MKLLHLIYLNTATDFCCCNTISDVPQAVVPFLLSVQSAPAFVRFMHNNFLDKLVEQQIFTFIFPSELPKYLKGEKINIYLHL